MSDEMRDEHILAAEERGYRRGYEQGRIDGAMDALAALTGGDGPMEGADLPPPGVVESVADPNVLSGSSFDPGGETR